MLLLILLILFTYPFLFYGPILTVLARVFAYKPSERSNDIESVALVICALNEQNIIGQKINNSLALDYPRNKLEIVVISDGSTDGTAAIAQQYKSAGIRLIDQPERRGKV